MLFEFVVLLFVVIDARIWRVWIRFETNLGRFKLFEMALCQITEDEGPIDVAIAVV